jgi:hypothetical protein
MGLGNAVRRYTKGIVPVLRQLASRGFKGSALGDLSYRGKRLAKAGQKLGITIKAIARGRDGVFLPTGICWGGALLFLVEPLSPVEYDLRADQGAPRRLRRDCLYFNGLITNDKFCLSRSGRLVLNWWRLPLRLRDRAREGQAQFPIRRVIGEVPMKRYWQVRWQMQPTTDGAWRWDRAYMLILRWSPSDSQSVLATESVTSPPTPEGNDEDSCLCARLDLASSAGLDHRAAAQPAPRPSPRVR